MTSHTDKGTTIHSLCAAAADNFLAAVIGRLPCHKLEEMSACATNAHDTFFPSGQDDKHPRDVHKSYAAKPMQQDMKATKQAALPMPSNQLCMLAQRHFFVVKPMATVCAHPAKCIGT